ncbi:MAG: thiamine pyrophosphate-binding protein, partial [Acidobacteriota bacterium]
MKTRGAHILWSVLVEQGVDTVFGYPGGAILPAYDALLDHPIRHVLVRHEQGATHMADGYARASGKVGVVIATSGPGATNLVTGIANAMMDSIPLVCITGQVPEHLIGSDAFQETDVTGITLPITKHNFLVTQAEEIAPTLRRAFEIATSGRPGPVLVDITKNAQQEDCEFEIQDKPQGLSPRGYAPQPTSIAKANELLTKAKKPVILAGHGILKSGAMAGVLELAERAHVPVAMTLLGIGSLPWDHPLNLGMMGMHGEHWVNEAIQEADLLIALGMRFDDRVTGKLSLYAPHAKKIHIDIDPSELHKNVRADVAIAGDLSAVLRDWLPLVKSAHHDAWIARIGELAGGTPVRDIEDLPDNGRLCAAHVIHDIWKA